MGGVGKRRTTKIRSKAIGGGIFGCFFSNFDKCRPEVADDFKSNVAVQQFGMDVCMKFSNSTLNRGLIIRLVAGWSQLGTYTQYSIAVSSRPEVISYMCM